MLNSMVRFLDRLLRQYTPDPFILAILLTAIVFALGLILTPTTASQMVTSWGDGFWKLNAFTFQMALVLVSGHAVASAPLVKKSLGNIVRMVRTPGQAIVVTTLVASVGCWLNWGFGLVLGGLICREIAKTVPKVNYRLLVASAYSGFLVWHGGLSASVPLLLATPGNFTEKLVGRTIPIHETLFSTYNIVLVLIFIGLLPVLNLAMSRTDTESVQAILKDDEVIPSPKKQKSLSFADRLEQSSLVSWMLFAFGASYLYLIWQSDKMAIDLDRVNFFFLFAAIVLHSNPANFVGAVVEAARKTGPILLQFPFYAGIMGMMSSSGLTEMISNAFISVSTPNTFNLLTFYSAAIVNLFVPSGGGQWAIQGPIVLQSAQSLGVDIPKAAMAVAWGGTWTDLLQPFWALPLLAIAGLRLRDVMGYLVSVVIITGFIFTIAFSII